MAHKKVLIAFSGGADSCLASFLGRKFLGKGNAIAVISTSPSLKRSDLDFARKFTASYDILLHEIITTETEDPNYLLNPTNRCYFCKSALYHHLIDLKQQKFPDFEIINGNNFNDLGDYRPGMDAAKEHDILSPFVACKTTKEDIRNISKEFGLFSWNKPASPCLSSRFPYGESISINKLKQVENAESFLLNLGVSDVRVRHYGNTAKIEVPEHEVTLLKNKTNEIENKILELGFTSLVIDEEGLISGKMNRAINKEAK